MPSPASIGGHRCARAIDGTGESNLRSTSLSTLRHMVASGMRITLLPALALGDAVGSTAAVPFAEPPPFRRMAIVWRATHPRAGDYAGIAEFLRAKLPEGAREVRAGTTRKRPA